MFWGAFDFATDANRAPGYSSSQYASAGASAAVGAGAGVRRATCILDRSTYSPALDPATMHFDFMNITSGAPDDTWTTTDFTNLETALKAFYTSLTGQMQGLNKFTTVSWHRVGPSAPIPNPAERISTVTATQPTGTANAVPPQVASSITFRTGVRKSWGRTYLPVGASFLTDGRLNNATTDAIAGAADTLLKAAATNDFYLVVWSKHLNSALAVEAVECDNVPDIIRRRRFKTQTYRKIINT